MLSGRHGRVPETMEAQKDIAAELGAALDRQQRIDRDVAVRMGVLMSDGFSAGEAMRALSLTPRDAAAAVARIKRVEHLLAEAA
jgi:hypothetical protein